ncbi:MAG: ABC transporter substrate binding protein [Thermodesulfobacteriota bacterium]
MNTILNRTGWFLAIMLLALVAAIPPVLAEKTFSIEPVHRPDGRRWRIAYLEGGAYGDYETVLRATVNALSELGWMEPLDLPEKDYETHDELWAFLASNARSEYIRFLADGFYTSDFKQDKRAETRKRLMDRIQNQKDIDLLIAMGTWAGKDLATDDHSVPTIVASTSDPVASGIVDSVEDSGRDHVVARVNPDRYANHVRLFHQIVGFRKLGIVYENSPEGRTFGAVADVEKVAREAGFEVVRCFAPFNDVTVDEAEVAVADCYAELAPKVDAVYITVHRGVTLQNMANILAPLNRHKVYSYSMAGSAEVRRGVLMSIAMAGYEASGLYYAQLMAKIFNGAKPRDLEQKLVDPPKIALNLKTANIINYDPSFDVLAAADEIYNDIQTAE